jgi:hypothetical protein
MPPRLARCPSVVQRAMKVDHPCPQPLAISSRDLGGPGELHPALEKLTTAGLNVHVINITVTCMLFAVNHSLSIFLSASISAGLPGGRPSGIRLIDDTPRSEGTHARYRWRRHCGARGGFRPPDRHVADPRRPETTLAERAVSQHRPRYVAANGRSRLVERCRIPHQLSAKSTQSRAREPPSW